MVNFDEKTHTYTNGNKVLISTTQLLKLAGISPNYEFVNETTLSKAAEKGSLVHKEIENYCKEGIIGFTEEVEQFIKHLNSNNYEVIASELLVHNDLVAGTVDLIIKKGEKVILVDIKTTSTIHTEAVSWQTSIYKDLYAQQVDELQVWQFSKGKLKVKTLIEKPKDKIKELYKLVESGETKLPTVKIDETHLANLYEVERIIELYEKKVKEAKEQQALIREKIISAMKENGVNKYENEKIIITYIAPTKTQTVDSARLKKEKPEIYNDYLKESIRNEQVRITLKENKND